MGVVCRLHGLAWAWFVDMKNERNCLLRDALPQLHRLALSLGVQLQLVDLRWGVGDEMAHDPRLGPVYLDQIRLCRQYSCGPNFVVSTTLHPATRSVTSPLSQH